MQTTDFGSRNDPEVLRMVPESRRRDVQNDFAMYVDHINPDEPILHAYDRLHGIVPIRAAVDQYKALERRGFNPLLLFYQREGRVWGLAIGSPVTLGGFEELDKILAQMAPDLRAKVDTHHTNGTLKD